MIWTVETGESHIEPATRGPIAAVLFDADGVMQRSGAFAAHMRQQLNWSEEDYQGFLSELFTHPLYDGCLEGRTAFLPTLEAVLASRACALSPEQFLAEWLRVGIETVPAAFGVVDRLRAAGVTCCLATNQDLERAAFMDEELGYGGRFDHSFYSCRMGVRKPSAEYFYSALATIEQDPAAVLFLDDHPANVDAAHQIGINAEPVLPSSDLGALVRRYGLLVDDYDRELE